MRRFLLSSVLALAFAACDGETEGTKHDDEKDNGAQVDNGGKPDKWALPGLRDSSVAEDGGPVDGSAHPEPVEAGGDGDATPRDGGTQGSPTFEGRYQVTTHYVPKAQTCKPLDEVTFIEITKLNAFEYPVTTAKPTNFIVPGTWTYLDEETLDAAGEEAVFDSDGFSYSVALGYSIGRPGATQASCSTSSFTVTGVRQ